MSALNTFFNNKHGYTIVIGVLLVVIVGISDYLTGNEISFSIFYLLPVSLISWYLGKRSGVVFSVICSILWALNEFWGGHSYTNQMFIYWNTLVRGIIFLLAALILSKLKRLLNIERNLRDSATLASSLKSEFLANMSHEIRTPMNAVIGTANLLSESDLNQDQKEYVKILKNEGDRLLKIINDILDLSKIETGQYTLDNITFNLYQLIEEVVSLMGARVREKNIDFSFKTSSGVPRYIIGDPDALRRVIINIIGNALKFTNKGKISLLIENETDSTNANYIRFSVSDTGVGIPKEKLDIIFTRFTQADSSITRKYGGTGLGLSISKKIVEMMSGNIWVESMEGHGSTFIFSIPAKIPALSEEIIDIEYNHKNDVIDIDDKRKLFILLVEDYDASRRIIQAYLKTTSYNLDIAENGKIAVEKYKANLYDLVLMDMQMPVMDGYEATKAIRAWEKKNSVDSTAIIALTAHAYKEDIQKSIDSGCNDHLTKPINKKKLLDSIYSNTITVQSTSTEGVSASVSCRIILPSDLQPLIPEFLIEMKEFNQTMKNEINNENYSMIREISHKMKGAGGSYGFSEISDLGAAIEKAATNNEKSSINIQLEILSEYLENVEVNYE
ncbi:ATP-binding protein [Candidatus Latescibacterota bacterium]